MRDTVVKTKDGRVFCGPIWEFKPKEGYLVIVTEDNDGKIFFKDMLSCVTGNQRVGINRIEDVDELKRARELGWEGD